MSKREFTALSEAFAFQKVEEYRNRYRTLFCCPSGPKISYSNGHILHVEDLNPEAHIQFRVGRVELLRLGWNCIKASLFHA